MAKQWDRWPLLTGSEWFYIRKIQEPRNLPKIFTVDLKKTEVQTHSKQGFPVIPKDGAKLPRAANAGHFGHSNKQNKRAPWISKNQTFTHLASGKVILPQHNNWQAQHKNLSPKNCFNYEKLTCNLQDLSLGTRNTCPPKKIEKLFWKLWYFRFYAGHCLPSSLLPGEICAFDFANLNLTCLPKVKRFHLMVWCSGKSECLVQREIVQHKNGNFPER